MVIQVLLDEDEDLPCQVRVLEHRHLRQGRQRVLLKHVLGIGRHRQVVLELHRGEHFVDDPESENTLAHVQRILLEVPRELVGVREVDPATLAFFLAGLVLNLEPAALTPIHQVLSVRLGQLLPRLWTRPCEGFPHSDAL